MFAQKYYTGLDGGILESFGHLFKNDLRLYVYPLKDSASADPVTAETLRVAPHLRHLYAYLLENRFIEPIHGYNENYLPIFSREVLARLRKGDGSWEQLVPGDVARIIKERSLFGWRDGNPLGETSHRLQPVEAPSTPELQLV